MDNTKFAKKRTWKANNFPLDKDIDVVARKGDKIQIKTMRYGKAIQLPKAKGWNYEFFQIGFHTYKDS